jgi:hypothetical protein
MGGRITYDEYRYRQTDAALQPKRPCDIRTATWNYELLRVTCFDCNITGKIWRGYLLRNLTEIRSKSPSGDKIAEDGLWLYAYCPWAHHLIRSEPLQVHPLEFFFLPPTKGKEVNLTAMPIVHGPPKKGANFLKAAMIEGQSAKVKIDKVRAAVDLPAGSTTVLDVEYKGKPYGFPLNVTNHKNLCKLYGNPDADEGRGTFDTDKVEGKVITLVKVMANNPREHREVETLRIQV